MIYGIKVPFEKACDIYHNWSHRKSKIRKISDFNGRMTNANGLVFMNFDNENVLIGIFAPKDPYKIPLLTKEELTKRLMEFDHSISLFVVNYFNLNQNIECV